MHWWGGQETPSLLRNILHYPIHKLNKLKIKMKICSASNKLTFLIKLSGETLEVAGETVQHHWIVHMDPFWGTPKWWKMKILSFWNKLTFLIKWSGETLELAGEIVQDRRIVRMDPFWGTPKWSHIDTTSTSLLLKQLHAKSITICPHNKIFRSTWKGTAFIISCNPVYFND